MIKNEKKITTDNVSKTYVLNPSKQFQYKYDVFYENESLFSTIQHRPVKKLLLTYT